CTPANAIPRDCSDLQRAGQNTSGVYTIFVNGGTTGRPVYCDMDTEGGGWTVKRERERERERRKLCFRREWLSGLVGVGEWGNDALHALTCGARNQSLRIELKNRTGPIFVARYSTFKVASESNLYKANVSGYSGPDGSDSFSYADGANFSTFDRDHDSYGDNCAEKFRGGWWYHSCHQSNLNGLNLNGQHTSYADGIDWSRLHDVTGRHHYSYPEVQMKIRKNGFSSGEPLLPNPLVNTSETLQISELRL
ncbi:unnamed protein product, partial [Ixodes hexagonus]